MNEVPKVVLYPYLEADELDLHSQKCAQYVKDIVRHIHPWIEAICDDQEHHENRNDVDNEGIPTPWGHHVEETRLLKITYLREWCIQAPQDWTGVDCLQEGVEWEN